MTKRLLIFRFLALFSASIFVGTSHAKDLELWFIPMSQDGPAKGPLTKWVSENVPKLLPGVTLANNYGPPIYQDAQQKLIVQGRRGQLRERPDRRRSRRRSRTSSSSSWSAMAA